MCWSAVSFIRVKVCVGMCVGVALFVSQSVCVCWGPVFCFKVGVCVWGALLVPQTWCVCVCGGPFLCLKLGVCVWGALRVPHPGCVCGVICLFLQTGSCWGGFFLVTIRDGACGRLHGS